MDECGRVHGTVSGLPNRPMHRNVAFEVRYAQRLLYYDRCGSIGDTLEAVLGQPFRASVPQMDAAEVKSEVEQLFFKFNSTSLIADHRFTSTPVRVIDLIGEAWKAIADRLEVRDRVIRLGMRTYFVIPFDSDDAAGAAILRTPYLHGVRDWDKQLGTATDAGIVIISRINAERAARIAVQAVKSAGTPELFNNEIRELLPSSAVQIDIDVHTIESTQQRTVTPTQIKAFAKGAAQWAREAANLLHKQIVGDQAK